MTLVARARIRAATVILAASLVAAFAVGQGGAAADTVPAPAPSTEPSTPATAGACPALPAGDHVLRIDTPDGARLVHLHAPPGADHPMPLVLALHGAGELGYQFAHDTGFSRLANREGFLVAYPTASGPRPFWRLTGEVPEENDIDELERSLDALESAACVDRSRVFATGVSNGGGMVARLACDGAQRLAGIAAVAGGYRTLPPCHPERPIPVMEIHGTNDPVVPYRGAPPDYNGSVPRWLWQWRQLDHCGGAATRSTPSRGVQEIDWAHCANGTQVVHVRLMGVAHVWPGGSRTYTTPVQFAATWRIWQFFKSLPSRAPE